MTEDRHTYPGAGVPNLSLKSLGSFPASYDDSDSGSEDYWIGTAIDEDRMSPVKLPYSSDMLAQGLSQPGKTADGSSCAYLRLDITGTDLATTEPLAACVHVQTAVLADNQLTSLRSLARLEHLTQLDVSCNKLSQVLQLDNTPGSSSNLRKANFRDNQVQWLADLGHYTRLEELQLDGNLLQHLSGLDGLTALQSLSLSANALLSCRGLQGLSSLRVLDISSNRLSTLRPLQPLSSLQVLNACNNALMDTAGCETLRSLRQLDISHNCIATLEGVSYVQHAALLSVLDLQGNPLEEAMNIRLHTVYLLPQVTVLNGQAVQAKEKVHAANMHGADAEALTAIRRRHFPRGELDDGGGALPPTAAGLIPSAAEEEIAAGEGDLIFTRVDAWAEAVAPEVALQGGVAALAEKLAAGCSSAAVSSSSSDRSGGGSAHVGTQRRVTRGGGPGSSKDALQLARACYIWVVRNVQPPRGRSTWSVGAPLFGPGGADIERSLLGAVTGTWAEKVAWLYMQLTRACSLEALMISGFWKDGSVPPGHRLATHNHCWTAVKVNGRWRLLDCVAGTLRGGHVPFFVPPCTFLSTHLPFEAYWQLLDAPVGTDEWWAMPEVTPNFFAAGGQLLDGSLGAVNVLPAPRVGEPLPTYMLPMAVQDEPNLRLRLQLLDANLAEVAAWQLPSNCGRPGASCSEQSPGQLVFQQAVPGGAGLLPVSFGCSSYASRRHTLWVSFPSPGDYYCQLQLVRELPGVVRLVIDDLDTPLEMTLLDVDEVLRFKVVVPSPVPPETSQAQLVSRHCPPALLPTASAAFQLLSCHLLQPAVDHRLEADRQEQFDVVVPGATTVLVGGDDSGWTELHPSGDGADVYSGTVVMPRSRVCHVVAQFADEDGFDGPQTLLSFPVDAQVQHIVETPVSWAPPPPDESDPQLQHVCEMFAAMDTDRSGTVTRKKMLLAFRRNRQYADFLKFPPRVKAADGTLDKFHDKFLLVNTDKLGHITLADLAWYMGGGRGASRDGSASSRRSGAATPGTPHRGGPRTPHKATHAQSHRSKTPAHAGYAASPLQQG